MHITGVMTAYNSRLAAYLRLGVSGSHARTSVAVPEPDVTVGSAATAGQ